MRQRSLGPIVVLAAAAAVFVAVVLRASPGAAAEPNDTFDSATAITFNATFRDAITTAGDVDYFVFTVSGTPTDLTATLQDLPEDFDLELYGPDRALLGRSNRGSTLSESIAYTATRTGSYYLRVYSPGGQSSASQYAVRVDAVEPPTATPTSSATATPTPTATVTRTPTLTPTFTPTDPYEPNDGYASAHRVASGETVRGRMFFATDRDFFKVIVPNPGSTVRVDLTDLPADYDLYLDKPDQSPAASSTNTGTMAEAITYESGSAVGYFYVAVISSRGGTSPEEYTLRVTVTAPSGAPAVFAVDTRDDEVDAAPGDGACRSASGACSLRAAVQETEALPGPQTILLPPETVNIGLAGAGEDRAATGDLDIRDDLSIFGERRDLSTIDGGLVDLVFDVHEGARLRLEELTVEEGAPDSYAEGAGSALRNAGTTTLVRTRFSQNGRPPVWGPNAPVPYCLQSAIENRRQLTIEASTIDRNITRGLFNSGTLVIRASSISGNFTHGSACRSSEKYAGGLLNNGTAEVVGSVINNNTVGGEYGGVLNRGTLTMTNVTVAWNSGSSDDPEPGGVGNAATGTLTLVNVTLAGNSGTGTTRGQNLENLGVVRLVNTIIGTGQELPNCRNVSPGRIESLGHNLEAGADTCELRGPGDRPHAVPPIDVLADNGGPTLTMALSSSSQALDAGDPAYCPATDQRGVARPQGARCDIGAFEYQPNEVAPTPTTTPTTVPAPPPPPGPNRLILPVAPEASRLG